MNAVDKELWEKIKQEIKEKYGKRWNAFYSGLLVQEYKRQGGKFKGKKPSDKENELRRWYAEKWQDIAPQKDVIVFRPTVKVTKDTPLTADKISKKELKKKVEEKRKIKGTNKNLTKFV